MAKELSVVGKDVTRLDATAKVTGEATFTVDVKLPGMLHAKYLRSPHAHAKVKVVDTSKAEKLPGVRGVVTLKHLRGKELLGDIVDDKVRFVGDAVAGVAAETEEIAREALELIKVAYEPLPELFGPEESLDPDAPKIWPGGGNLCTFKPRSIAGQAVSPKDGPTLGWKKGDMDKGFAEADVVVENTVDTHAQFHCCFEPHACVARWDSGMGELTFWVGSQDVHGDRDHLAHCLEVPTEKVRLICTYTGGAFGSKAHNVCKEYLMTAILSKRLRRPVRYEPTRAEESLTAVRHPANFYYKIGAKKDGTLTAIYLKCVRGGGAHTAMQPLFLRGSTDYVAPVYFMCPNVEYEGWALYTTLPVAAAFRGFGYFESGTVMDQTMDMLAEKLGMDPLDLWLKNVPTPGYPIGKVQGPLTTAGVQETIEKCGEAIGWKRKWHKPGEKTLSDGRKHGIGIGHAMGRATVEPIAVTATALISLQQDGSVHLMVGVSDMGQGQVTGLAQIAAETLGVPIEDLKVTWGDSIASRSNPQVASSTTIMSGNATRLAAEDARQQVLSIAARLLKAKPEELDIQQGAVYAVAAPKKRIPIGKIVSFPGIKSIVAHGRWSIDDTEAFARSMMACIAEVTVDTETGKIELINMVQGNDCGKILGRARLEGQIQGVLSGGVGFVFLEDWIMDEQQGGRIMNANLSDYKLTTTLDTMDQLQPSVIVESNDHIGPYGARGMGEAVLSASGPAILNAVYNAIGVRFAKTPITPDKVLEALGKI